MRDFKDKQIGAYHNYKKLDIDKSFHQLNISPKEKIQIKRGFIERKINFKITLQLKNILTKV